MEELTLNDQIILFDRPSTVSVYQSIEELSTDTCSCAACKNFRQFRHEAYGPKLLALLRQLGVNPMKEWEVYWAGEEADNRVQYGGWFPFVGDWSPNQIGRDVFDFPKPEEAFFTFRSFPNATKLFGPKVLAVEFVVKTPKAQGYISDFM